jgi:prepilin-type N-terminal cleavage/methylation domain-containing protein
METQSPSFREPLIRATQSAYVIRANSGHTLIELVVVMALLCICMVAGTISLASGVGAQEARGSAQSWQAAAAWAQVGVLWHGGSVALDYDDGNLALAHDFSLCGGSLGPSAPAAAASANLGRWAAGGGVGVTFGGPLASPDGGGSIYSDALRTRYRVVVRPESGLTVRSLSVIEP